jgi:imidazolonepropionase-like amidohydrolase
MGTVRLTLVFEAVCAVLVAATLGAQAPGGKAPSPDVPPLPKANASAYVIQNAKIYTLAGAPIERGSLVIQGGKIAAVGASVTVPAGAEIVNGQGLEIYPGLFDSVTLLGLTEIGAVNATNDYSETGNYNPQLDAASAINPVSDHIPVARANGITHAISAPGPYAPMGGQASAISLDGWTIEEMLINRSVALTVTWPSLPGRNGFDPGTSQRRQSSYAESKQSYETKVQELEDWLDRARRYQQATHHPVDGGPPRDLKLESLGPVLRGERPVLVRADNERDIRNAIAFFEKQQIRMILAGAADAYKVTDLLAQKKIPVILGPTQSMPSSDDEPYDIRNTTPGVLQKAGVLFALATFDSSDSRNLPYEIGNAVSYGLGHDDAIKAITLNPARIFGLDKQLGTLEAGKIANLIVTTGDPLEIQTQVKYLFINGRPASLDNRHLNLYEKWRSRPLPAPGAGSKAPVTTSSR